MNQDLLTPDEVASILKISKYTVYEMIKRGDIQAIKIGRKVRVDRADLDSYLQSGKRNVDASSSTDVLDRPVLFSGSHDLSIDTVVQFIKEKYHMQLHTSFVGSMEGLMQLFHGRADIAGCHLFDEETGEYNLPYIKRLLPGESIHIVHFVKRNIGWVVPKGNPKKLHGWTDIKRKDLRFINRQKGSGTRILFDFYLKQFQVNRDAVLGYDSEEQTHYGACAHVVRGSVDVALATESAAHALGLDFILLEKESFVFVMLESFSKTREGKIFLNLLQSDELKNKIHSLGGYDVTNMGETMKGEN